MFYDRAIRGLWVTADGLVYRDFDKDKHIVDTIPDELSYYVGVDWGFEHKNSIVVLGDDPTDGTTYLIKEITGKHQYVQHWIDVAHEIQNQYGEDINFWCDSARPEYVQAFLDAGINARNADKSIMAGVESVGSRMRQGKFKVNKNGIEDFLDEIYQYVWNEQTGEPLKKNDDVMDATRYGVYNQHKGSGLTFMNNNLF